MKKKFLVIASTFLFSTLASSAFAGCSTMACTASIDQLILWYDGRISIRLHLTEAEYAVVENAGTCFFGSGRYVALNQDNVNFQTIYAGLLTRKTMGDVVSIRLKDNGAACEVSYVIFD